jgi:hypothetical protein
MPIPKIIAWFDGAEVETPVYDGARLRAGELDGYRRHCLMAG